MFVLSFSASNDLCNSILSNGKARHIRCSNRSTALSKCFCMFASLYLPATLHATLCLAIVPLRISSLFLSVIFCLYIYLSLYLPAHPPSRLLVLSLYPSDTVNHSGRCQSALFTTRTQLCAWTSGFETHVDVTGAIDVSDDRRDGRRV